MISMQDNGEELNPEKPRPMTLEDWHRIQEGQRDAAEARAQALIKLGEELREDRSGWETLYPLHSNVEEDWGPMAQFLSLPIKELPFMVQAYVNHIETERTNRLCKCEWIIHPDDVDKPEGSRRIRKGQEHAACPVHTKIGFLLYFFDHYFRSECPACPPDCKSCTYTRECECYTHGSAYTENDSEITQDVTAVALPDPYDSNKGGVSDAKEFGDVLYGGEISKKFTMDNRNTKYTPIPVIDGDEPESRTSRMETVELPNDDDLSMDPRV